MYHVYLLKSKKNGILYIGYTNNVERRLKEHNSGLVEYTRKYMPWEIVYYESFFSLVDAKKREKSLKYFGKAYSGLKLRIENSLNKKEGAG
ncbi:MAG: GIY-YIG nuclease family protein [Candidatus Omnitrophica bacterium]|nr:GIY-YIG nuclease family protein [Candidatus Omnitrophota bacterium]MDD5771239.1 GIY-YIG nuclease family protein [Candidatus Omnitrophota bacterium]